MFPKEDLRFALRFGIVVWTAAAALLLGVDLTLIVRPAWAGVPPSCRMADPKNPVCAMASCAAVDKDGKRTGSNCSKRCTKQCCQCDANICPQDENQIPPEQWIRMAFGD